jgi:NTP pyrophosphatase (non-canonical NTP hydrolase)
MKSTAKIDEIKKYKLEDWVKIFGEMNRNADADRNASSLWLDVIKESTTLAEHVRKDEFQKAIETIPDVFSRLMSFVAKYSINLTPAVIRDEGIDLRSDTDSGLSLTEWVLDKYPGVCSSCAQKPCVCHSLRYEWSTKKDSYKFAETMKTLLMKRRSWESEITGRIDQFSLENLFKMFNEIYTSVHHDPPMSSLCFHFFEEVGEVADLLLSFNSIQYAKTNAKDCGERSVVLNLVSNRAEQEGTGDSHKKNLRYLNNVLKSEISDVVSWIIALINKINCLIRATHSYYNRMIDQENNSDITYKQITLSELLLDRFYDNRIEKFVCPFCKSERCSPQCKQNRIIQDIENKVRREDDLMYEMRRATGQERRKCVRKSTDDRIRLGNDDIYIVDISENNMGFLSNTMLSLNEEKEIIINQKNMEECIKIKITRPARADTKKTGFQYFHGAEILAREKRPKQAPPPSAQRSTKRPARSTSP